VAVAATFAAAQYDLLDGLTLSVIAPSDVPAIATMFAAIDPWKSYPITADQLAGFFGAIEPGAPRFAIHVDGALAGAVSLRTHWFRGPYIQTFALSTAHQGRGVGSTIMAFIERDARTAGERNLWVAVSDFNVDAQRFYARHGFEQTAAIPDLVRDGRTELLLRKRLT
jgi:ribosomal protein S18 acetylase RimI-like enzyme